MDLAVAQEGCVFEAGDEAEDARLLAELEVVLEADEVVAVGAEIFLAELHDGVRPPAGARIREARGLHRAEAERVAAAAGCLFDGKAALEVLQLRGFLSGFLARDLLPLFRLNFLRGDEGVEEAVVLLFGEGQLM